MDLTVKLSFDAFAKAMLSNEWTFAKTMPESPHCYTLRKKWHEIDGVTFEDCVTFIREHGYKRKYGGRSYTYFDINGMKYWTMGAALPATILINQAVVEHPCPYDELAGDYDGMFENPEALEENREVSRLIGYKGGTVLDIGCGTGTFMGLNVGLTTTDYLGIDPSRRMLDVFENRMPWGIDTLCTGFERFYSDRKFDLVASLFCPLNYVSEKVVKRVPKFLAPGGRYFLMFYKDNYLPKTHAAMSDPPVLHRHGPDVLPGTVTEFGNYFIIEGRG